MSPSDSCFIQAISGNDNYHPKLTNLSLVYYNDFKKGYVFVIDHSEGLKLERKNIETFINSHKKVYLLDSKFHSYFLDLKNSIDLQFVNMNQSGKYDEFDCNTLLHRDFDQKYHEDSDINKIIPISKHYEKCECLLNRVANLIDLETDIELEKRLFTAYKNVETKGIKIDKSKFDKKYQLSSNKFSIKDNIVYGSYNLYNITGRPTNSFNGLNFLAIPKEKEFRECFIPKNDIFVEFDFDSYHLRLIAKLTGHEWPLDCHPHVMLGKQYFETPVLTEAEYKKAKEITFKQLYGGVEEQYKHIPFFSTLDKYIDNEWKKFNKFGATVLSTGRTIKKTEEMNKMKLFNYIVQNLETKTNLDRIEKILNLLGNKKSELVLITYDSFLFDFCLEDGKHTLSEIKNILQQDSLIVKHKYGKDYSL